ncbi:AAA family ATPase [Enemella sp. A6]|uniref:AAA family ATPase n=1 Tax=Enemella sp. A6 TaxID=3440152 RepID=UPI003EC0C7CA
MSNQPVRRWLLLRELLEVLEEADEPIRGREAMERVGQRLRDELTAYELERVSEDGEQTRWQVNLSFGSTDMRVAGWMTKSKGLWAITEAGRQALQDHPDGVGLDALAARGYRQARQKQQKHNAEPNYARVLRAAIDIIEPGTWTTYGELAQLASVNAQTVGNFAGRDDVENAYRILSKGGVPSPDFTWADGRTGTQREALEAEGVEFDESGAADEAQHVRTEDLRAFLEEKGVLVSPTRRGWLVRGASVDGQDLIPGWLADGFVSLRATRLREVAAGIGRTELKEIVDDDYSQTSYASKAAKLDEFHAFLSRMKLNDIVVTTSQGRVYLGTVVGEAEYNRSPDGPSSLTRAVDWAPNGYDHADLDGEIQGRLQVQSEVVEMTQQLELLTEMLERSEETSTPEPVQRKVVLPEATDELAESLHVPKEWLAECIELLRDRPQLIFYGPPGTGKTYIAQRLAGHLAGDNVRLVQFHPGYSYEDFFEGYRPQADGGFVLRPGPLRQVVDAARENPTTPHVLIIDEINRGNLAKIFGELYFLLEYRDEPVDLLYATEEDSGFTLPRNVFLIGTMNTADRSIALVDAAMRRRFSFVALHPSLPPTDELLRKWLQATDRDPALADLLDELNSRIEDSDFKIGPSYLMRPAVHQPGGLERTWRTAILPLLEEHHYGDGTDVAGRYGLPAIRARVTLQAEPAEGSSEQPADPA